MTPPEGYQQGHLVTISDQAEHNWLFVFPARFGQKAWLGITDEAVTGEWRWVDDTPGIWQDPKLFASPVQTSFAKWRTGGYFGEQSLPPYDLTSLTRSFGITGYIYDHPGDPTPYAMTWNTTSAADRAMVIVEFEPVPEPSTIALAMVGAALLVICRRRTANYSQPSSTPNE